jgi:hypothetical protein
MLAKFLAFLLQSKAAAVSAVLLVGTTGALVSASTQNGVTTITVTPAANSASPATNANLVAVTTKTEDEDKNEKAQSCAADQSLVDAVKTVNSTFAQDHTALMHLRGDKRGDAAEKVLESTDKTLKQIRHAAVEAIHDLNTCAKQADQDKESAEQDEDKTDNDNDKDTDNDDDKSTSATNTNTTTAGTNTATKHTITFTATDAKGIADEAVKLMTDAMADAKAKLAALPATPTKKSSDREHSEQSEHD